MESGDSFSFSVNIAEGYRKGKEFSVKAGDSTLKEGSDGTYTIKEIKKDVKVKISGVEKIEDTDEAPNDQAAEENSETTDAESGAASASDESAAPADSETVTEETPAPADSKTVTEEPPVPADSKTVTEDPMNSGESSYDLYVDGIPVTADNKGDILGEDDDEGGETRKTAVYDAEKNTLTLDEAALSSERPGPAVRYEGTEELTLIFKGSCFLLGKADQNVGDGVTSYGISASNGSLHIKAGGKGLMTISNQEAITGKDISFDEELCPGPQGIYVIPGGHGLTGDDSGVTIASSHQWSPLDYEWSKDYSTCTATKNCSNNVDHKDSEEGKVTSEVVPPTATEPGKTIYTATFEDEVYDDQTMEVDDPEKPALGYRIFVEGVLVTEDNKNDILGDNTIAYDPDKNVLKLNGAAISSKDGPAVRYTGDGDLTIEFKGNNTLTGTAKDSVGDGVTAYGIFVGEGSLVIKADGKGELRITNEEAISGMDISIDENLCLGPEGVYVIPGGTGFSCESGVVIAASHNWNEPTYSWADDYSTVTAVCVCKNNEGHVEEETVTPTKTVTKKASCEDAGELTYTAAFESKAFTEQIKKVQSAALGHQWGDPVFSWSDENTKAEVIITCKRDSSHTKTVEASVKKSITLPERNEDGGITYTATATVDGETISETKETVIKPAGTAGYKFTAQSYSWAKGSSNQLNLTVKRNEYDEITFSEFTKITIDGKDVKSANYKAEEGSLKLALKKEYLQNLAAGTHTLKAQFMDGSAETKFTITAKNTTNKSSSKSSGSKSGSSKGKSGSSPRTGDDTNAALWIGILAAAMLGIAVTLFYRRRGNTKK